MDWFMIDASGASNDFDPNTGCSCVSPSTPELFFFFIFLSVWSFVLG
jgi:hypothetical protein